MRCLALWSFGEPRLRGLLDVLPDNKIVEDIHNAIRRDANKGASKMRCTTRVQDVATATGVLEERHVAHTARVTKEHFVRHFKTARASGGCKRHYPARHTLPMRLAGIMGRKVWHTVAESWSRKGIAAWEWLQNGHANPCPNAGPGARTLDSALFSRLVASEMVLLNLQSGNLMASLGNASWAVLLWPVDLLESDIHGMRTMQLRAPAGACFGHITDPSLWQVVPYTPERRPQGIVLQQSGPPESLVRACLRRPKELAHHDLIRLAAHLEIAGGASDSRKALLDSIARKVSDDNADFVSQVHIAEEELAQKGVATLLQDPVFEAAYGEMPEDDKLEFPEIRQEIRKGRVRRHIADRVVQAVQRKRRQGGLPLPKRRVRARREGSSPAVAPGPMAPLPAASAAGAPSAAPPPQVAAPPVGAPSADPPPEVAAPPVGAPGAAPLPEVEAPMLERIPRGQQWGRGRFVIARTHRSGELHAITVTCLLHSTENARCNKNVNLGDIFSEAEATQRIKEWCVRGLDIPAGDGAREMHMHERGRPRFYSSDELRSVADLEALGNA
jgi:hypothetical protein